ncbi:hypothetical protein B0H65DRAFT_41108 [Neurospora tetraspora]|uniref:RhoGAP-domain-containing protein n=1 Tax=Neurospora tetraspora TaxID=94610 RepID=A0AAE0JQN1_9PEZI|nr:hypothetical protein B0H65DRAFT_41108 [Neurospora tetraspora]
MSLGDASAPATSPTPDSGSPVTAAAPAPPTAPTPNDETKSHVQDVLSSEIGIATMLNRLKQSIASAKEFATFLKKRSVLEDEHANGLRKLCKASHESSSRSEHRGGTFAKAYEDMMTIHERMAENGTQFAMSLHQMHEDLLELAGIAEKSRKGWKQSGLTAEQRVADLEAAMRKSKSKYDALAEEYDRARTGDTTGQQKGKMFGFKGPKSAAQHEEDLLRKAQAADQDYQAKVNTVQTERGELLNKIRPDTIKALQEIVRECDAGVVLQMQKFASFNEKLLLSNGLSISPLKHGPEARSLRECVQAIDNDKDLDTYLLGQYPRLPPRTGEPKYEKNALLDPANRTTTTPYVPPGGSQPTAPTHSRDYGSMNSRTGPLNDTPTAPLGHHYGQSSSSIPMIPATQQSESQPSHERSFSHGNILSQMSTPFNPQYGDSRGAATQQAQAASSRYNGAIGSISSSGPPQLGELPFQYSQPQSPPSTTQQPPQQPSQPPPQQTPQQPPFSQPPPQSPAPLAYPSQQGYPAGPAQGRQSTPPMAQPTRQVFGMSLSRLYERDGLAVPMVVYQCIQAVDLFGLGLEGIYRLSGSVPHVNKLKTLFDTDSGSSNLDFRNPENFFHDVNSVAGLLKQFFRDLPDPLLTKEHYASFIEAAKNEDETVRRDSLHAIINSLPDPNYATLRALTLHLHRVIDNSSVNRMSSQNLAIVFGPTLMGTAGPGANIADAGWQVRVVDTILQNTYQIFDDDD